MSCTLTTTDATPTVVDLVHGPEWGYQSSITQAIEWRQMTSGRWRRWDAGPERDIYASTWTHQGPRARVDAVIALIASLRGKSILLQSTEGFWPFGPLVDCSTPVPVRIGPYSPSGVLVGADRWQVELPLYLAVPQALPAAGSLAAFLARAYYSPSVSTGWSVSQRESLIAPVQVGEDSHQATATALLSPDDVVPVVRQLLRLRGGTFRVPGAALPFGPGVPPSSGSGGNYDCRAISVSWTHQTPNLWQVSATLVREP